MDQKEELTFGQKAVGLTFNPSGNPAVTDIKQRYADLIDILNAGREDAKAANDFEKVRHFSVAITDNETAQMRAVKAITLNLKEK